MRLRSLYTHRRWIPVALFVILFVLTLFFVRRVSWVQNGMEDVRFAFARFGTWSGNVLGIFGQRESELRDRVAELEAQLQARAFDQVAYEELLKEQAALQALLGYMDRETFETITARVLSRSSERSGDLLLIDRGSEDGIIVGQAVIVEDGIFVGTITQVESFSSTVRLATDRESKLGIQFLGESTETLGIAEGSDGAFLRVSYIPQDVTVDVHDLVATSGLDGSIPAGLIVGLVTSVTVDEHNPFQSAYVEPLIDLRGLSFVGVLTISL